MVLSPIQQSQLKLGHALQHVGVILALAHFLGHVGAHIGDAGVAGVLLVGDQQVQLGVFLNLHTQLVQAVDGGVAGEEVLGPGAEGDNLQVLNADDGAGDGHKLGHLVGQLLGGAHGILGDIAGQAAQAQVVGAVEHAAVGVAAAVNQVAVALGGSHEHAGAVKVLGDKGFGGFRAKVAQEHGQGVAASLGDFFHGSQHVLLVLNGSLGLVHFQALSGAGSHNGGPAVLGKLDGEAIAGYSHNTQLDLRDVVHCRFLHFD